MAHFRRRDVTRLLGGAAAWPLAARAQQPERIRQIAILANPLEDDPDTARRLAALRWGLDAFGWVEGKNMRLDIRWGSADPERALLNAREVTQSGAEVVLTNGITGTTAMKRATSRVPVVFAIVDPVGEGLVEHPEQPGGNLTGFSAFEPEIGGKWIGLLKEMAPEAKHIGLLFNPSTLSGGTKPLRLDLEKAARALDMEPVPMPVESTANIERSLSTLGGNKAAGVIVMPDSFLLLNGPVLVRTSLELRLPMIFPIRYFARLGGLMSYGVDPADLILRAASYVDRILRGERPGDLPVQALTQYELVINLRTSKALGIEVPPRLLARANDVIR